MGMPNGVGCRRSCRSPEELGATERPAAQQTAAPDAASQAIVVEREKPVVAEKVVEKAVTD